MPKIRRYGGLLSGLRVVEAATMVMVPSVGALLADYGAEVVKIEPLEGDLNRRGHHIPGCRSIPPTTSTPSCPTTAASAASRSISRRPRPRAIVRRLVERADVFLTNYRHRALERLGLTWPELEAINPRLVYAHGTGFGDRGAEADKPGFDSVCYWSRSAMEATLFPMEGWLGSLGYGTGDHPSGMALFSSVLLALLARERTGKGDRVSCSLVAAGAWSNAVLIQARLLETRFQERRPREDARNFTGVYYRAGDGRIFKMAIVDTEGGWPKVCRAIGRADLIDDPRYATFEERSKDGRMRELILLCDQIFASQPMDHWKRALEAADVPYSVVSNYDDVVADPQLAGQRRLRRDRRSGARARAHRQHAVPPRRPSQGRPRPGAAARRAHARDPGADRDRPATRSTHWSSAAWSRWAGDLRASPAGVAGYLSDFRLVSCSGSAADSVMSILPSGLIASSIAGATVPVPSAGSSTATPTRKSTEAPWVAPGRLATGRFIASTTRFLPASCDLPGVDQLVPALAREANATDVLEIVETVADLLAVAGRDQVEDGLALLGRGPAVDVEVDLGRLAGAGADVAGAHRAAS